MTATAPRTVTVTLPLPPAGMNPNNSRGGFVQLPNGRRLYPKARIAADYRQECGWEMVIHGQRVLDGQPAPFYFARLSFTFRWCTGRRAWDADNALSAAKPLVDSLRDAGLLRDDSARRVTYGTVESVKCKRGCRCGGGVEIVIEEITAKESST